MDTEEERRAVVVGGQCLTGDVDKLAPQETVSDGVMPTGLADEKSVETVASISSSTTVSKNPTTLDTLPTEMKNEIFSYLLLGKNVKTPVPGPDPRFKYHFQTSILLANKNISHAAQSYLYGRNNFAVISIPQTIEDHFSQYMHPAVSRHHVQAIRHHAIRAHFETRQIMSRDAARKKSQTPVASAEPGKTTGILMLLEDLIQLCDSLQLGNHVERGDHIFIMSPPSAKRIKYQVCDIPNLTKTRIFVQLRQTPYLPDRLSSSQELERQKDLLRPFQSLANNIHKVSVKGANDRLSDLLVERLSSRLSWPNAMGWNLFELSLRHADRMAGLRKSGHWDETWFVWDLEANADNASIHNQLMTVSRSRTTLYDKTMPENSADRAVSWQLGITIFAIECYLTTAAFYAKRGDRECFERVVHKALNFVAGVPSLDHLIPFDVVKLVQHCYVLAVALRGTVQDSIRAVEVAKGPTMIKNEIHHAEEGVAAIEHDLSLLHEFIHTEGQSNPLTFETSNLAQILDDMRPQCYEKFKRPKKYDGWTDTEHLLEPEVVEPLYKAANDSIASRIATYKMEVQHDRAVLQMVGFIH